ncbi:hypothetical protein A3Q56_03247 [Intoshia linei]|uniref:Uncharacterized protein n=1 Tax=Intoshia linei TaxID=1819745 RepID=A0A177B3W3_9BILA|nr:hypothetical protein A3Q56_03247 [Intoshia linei]
MELSNDFVTIDSKTKDTNIKTANFKFDVEYYFESGRIRGVTYK